MTPQEYAALRYKSGKSTKDTSQPAPTVPAAQMPQAPATYEHPIAQTQAESQAIRADRGQPLNYGTPQATAQIKTNAVASNAINQKSMDDYAAANPLAERDHKSEADMAKKLGGLPQSDQEKALMYQATYSPQQLKANGLDTFVNQTLNPPQQPLGGAGGQLAAFDPAKLKAAGLSDEQIQSLQASGGAANQMQANLNATPKPTNSSLSVLEEALKAKSGVGNQTLGGSDLFKKAGLNTTGASGYGILAQNLAQHSQEMNSKYQNYANLVGTVGGQMSDTYNAALEGYKATMDQYNTEKTAIEKTNQRLQDHLDALDIMKQQNELQQKAYAYQRKIDDQYKDPQFFQGNDELGPGFIKDGKFTPLDLPAASAGDYSGYLSGSVQQGGGSNESFSVPGVGPYSLGKVAGKYESGNNYGRVSSGVGDAGGKSYGSHQFARGSITNFLNDSGYAKQFAGMPVGSAKFDAKWKELASNDPNFGKAQDAQIARTHYEPQLKKVSAIGLDKRGPAIQEMIYSTGVQYGPQSNVILEALKGKNVSHMTDADIISAVQDYKVNTVGSYFGSSSPAVRAGVAKRHGNEKKDLLALDKAAAGAQELTTGKPVAGLFHLAQAAFSKGGDLYSEYSQNKTAEYNHQQEIQKGIQEGTLDEEGNPLNVDRQIVREGSLSLSEISQRRKDLEKAIKRGNEVPEALKAFDQDVSYGRKQLNKAKAVEKAAIAQEKLDNPNLTESQGSAYNAGLLAKESLDEFQQYESTYNDKNNSTLQKLLAASKPSDTIGNFIQNSNISSDARQRLLAEANFVAATLRKESGASISVDEYRNKGALFFPRPGDDEKQLNFKKRLRKGNLSGIIGQMGAAGKYQFDKYFSKGQSGSNQSNNANDPLGISSSNGGDPLNLGI